jgi:hypothetical protein
LGRNNDNSKSKPPDKSPETFDNFGTALRALLTSVLLSPFAIKAADNVADGRWIAGGVYSGLVLLILIVSVYWKRIEALSNRAGIVAKSKAKLVLASLVATAVIAGAFSLGTYIGRREGLVPSPIGNVV